MIVGWQRASNGLRNIGRVLVFALLFAPAVVRGAHDCWSKQQCEHQHPTDVAQPVTRPLPADNHPSTWLPPRVERNRPQGLLPLASYSPAQIEHNGAWPLPVDSRWPRCCQTSLPIKRTDTECAAVSA